MYNNNNLYTFRSQACTVRDQILWEERNDEKRIRLGGRGSEKNRKKLAELEAQLVLASPNLVLRVAHKSQHRVQNSYTFFLSSEFERSQWVEAVEALQQVMRSHMYLDKSKVRNSQISNK